MVNEDFDVAPDCEDVLDVFKSGRDAGEPWGYATPRHIMDETGMDKPNVEYYLRRLHDAGWIEKPSRGFYRFVDDPREN